MEEIKQEAPVCEIYTDRPPQLNWLLFLGCALKDGMFLRIADHLAVDLVLPLLVYLVVARYAGTHKGSIVGLPWKDLARILKLELETVNKIRDDLRDLRAITNRDVYGYERMRAAQLFDEYNQPASSTERVREYRKRKQDGEANASRRPRERSAEEEAELFYQICADSLYDARCYLSEGNLSMICQHRLQMENFCKPTARTEVVGAKVIWFDRATGKRAATLEELKKPEPESIIIDRPLEPQPWKPIEIAKDAKGNSGRSQATASKGMKSASTSDKPSSKAANPEENAESLKQANAQARRHDQEETSMKRASDPTDAAGSQDTCPGKSGKAAQAAEPTHSAFCIGFALPMATSTTCSNACDSDKPTGAPGKATAVLPGSKPESGQKDNARATGQDAETPTASVQTTGQMDSKQASRQTDNAARASASASKANATQNSDVTKSMLHAQKNGDVTRQTLHGSKSAGESSAKQGMTRLSDVTKPMLHGEGQASDQRSRARTRVFNNININNINNNNSNAINPEARVRIPAGPRLRLPDGRYLFGKELEGFEAFWKAFDLARGKANAAEAWLDLCATEASENSPDSLPRLFAYIISAARQEAEGREAIEARGGIPIQARNWLLNRRWLDYEEPVSESEKRKMEAAKDTVAVEQAGESEDERWQRSRATQIRLHAQWLKRNGREVPQALLDEIKATEHVKLRIAI